MAQQPRYFSQPRSSSLPISFSQPRSSSQLGSYSQPDIEALLTEASPVARSPLLIKVTGYRLTNTILGAIFGIWKAIASYKGQSVVPTTLEFFMGVFVCNGLYWLGFLESVEPPVAPWFFHDDHALHMLFLLYFCLAVVAHIPIAIAFWVYSFNCAALLSMWNVPPILVGTLPWIPIIWMLLRYLGWLYIWPKQILRKYTPEDSLYLLHFREHEILYRIMGTAGFCVAFCVPLFKINEFDYLVHPRLRSYLHRS